jgi:hypothetical protein
MATGLIGHHAIKRHREKPRRHCARCGDFVRHGDDHLRVQMHGATSLFYWRCFHRDHATILYAVSKWSGAWPETSLLASSSKSSKLKSAQRQRPRPRHERSHHGYGNQKNQARVRTLPSPSASRQRFPARAVMGPLHILALAVFYPPASRTGPAQGGDRRGGGAMKRCYCCHGWIWPWQRRTEYESRWFHAHCWTTGAWTTTRDLRMLSSNRSHFIVISKNR